MNQGHRLGLALQSCLIFCGHFPKNPDETKFLGVFFQQKYGIFHFQARSDIVVLITKSPSCATVVWGGEPKWFTENAHGAKIYVVGQRSHIALYSAH